MLIIKINTPYQNEFNYICDVVLTDFLGIDYEIIFHKNSEKFYEISDSTSTQVLRISNAFWLTESADWLSERMHPEMPLRFRTLNNLPDNGFLYQEVPVIFGRKNSSQEESEMYFDIDLLGSIFFLITKMETFTNPNFDEYKRFDTRKSVLFLEKIHERAIGNEYIEILWHLLYHNFGNLKRKQRNYEVVLSHDVDYPLSLNKSLKSVFTNIVGDVLVRKDAGLAFKRFIGLISKNKKFDPNNNFDFIMAVSEKYNLKSAFNFICVNGHGGIDGNYNIEDTHFKNLFQKIAKRNHIIGFHPSFHSYNSELKIAEEFNKLKTICHSLDIFQNKWGGRHHFLRFENPTTWQYWENVGLEYDSSCGSGYNNGFWTGVCFEYKVFNLKERKSLKLTEQPLIFMDVAANEDIIKVNELKKLSNIVRFYSGQFTFLFHNNYIRSRKEKENYISYIDIIQ